jgi:hypothetical protein
VSTVDGFDPEDEDPEDDDDPDACGGPLAVTTPGVVVPEGSWIDTCCPTATVGSLGVSGTDTERVVVVT